MSQLAVEHLPVQRAGTQGEGHSHGEELRPLDPERVNVRRQGRPPRLLHHPVQVVAEQQADGGDAHGRPVAERTAGEVSGRDPPPVASPGHCLDDQAGAPAVAALGVVVGREGLAQRFLQDLPVLCQRLGDPNHHLGVVCVEEGLRSGLRDEFGRRAVAPEEVVGRQALVGRPDGIPDRQPEEASRELLRGWSFQHVGCLRLASCCTPALY